MRIRHRFGRKSGAAAIMLAVAACAPAARATTRTWDVDSAGHNNNQVNNASGTWDLTTSNWTTNTGTNNSLWTNNDDAVFGGNPGIGAAGTITVSGTVSANSITFNPAASGNFLLTGGTVNLTGSAMIIKNASATIGSVLGGSVGLTKTGTATLTLTGANTISGAVVIDAGTTILSGSSGALASATSYTINAGGTLRLDNSVAAGGNHGSDNRLATAPITLNGGTLDFINDGTSSSETTGSLTAAIGASTSSFGSSGQSTLNFGAYARTAGATLNFTNLGAFNHTITFSSGVTAGSFIDQGTFVDGADYAVYDSGGFIRAMTSGVGDSYYATGLTASRHSKLTATGSATTSISVYTLNLNGSAVGINFSNDVTLTVSKGGIIKSGGGSAASITSGNANGNLTTGAGTEWVIRTNTAADQLTIAKKILGGSGLTKTGLGTLILDSTSDAYGGKTTVAEGTLKLSSAGVIPDTSDLVVAGGATFDLNSNNETLANITLYDGTITSASAATLVLNGNAGTVTYSGKTGGATMSGSASNKLSLADITTAATHVFSIADGAAANDLNITYPIQNGSGVQGIDKQGLGTLRLGATNSYTGVTNITAGTLQLDGSTHSSSTVNVGTAGTLTGVGDVNGNATITGSGVVNFSSGGIIDGTLTATGGNWNGVGSVTGATAVNSGTFTVNGTMAGSGAVNVNSTAKLAGTGTISKTVNVNTGGTLSPGGDGTNSNVGKLSTNAQTWGTNSAYTWEIKDATGAAGTGYDTVAVTGALTVNATNVSGNKMTIKLISHGAVANWNPALNTWNWIIASATSISGFSADKFVLDTTDFADDNDCTPSLFQVNVSGSNIRVAYVPEPASTLLLGGMSAVGILGRRRRRKS